MSPKLKLLYSLLTGLLLGMGWPPTGFSPLLLIAWIPLWLVEYTYRQPVALTEPQKSKLGLFGYAYLSLLVFNINVSWWIYNASVGGAVAAWLENTFVMTLSFMFAHSLMTRLQRMFKSTHWLILANVPFIAVWLSFEYFHHNWDLSYPWLTLGNGLAADYKIIQWYEYTGVLGGSLWILAVNAIVFYITQQAIDAVKKPKQYGIAAAVLAIVVAVPIVFSLQLLEQQKNLENTPPSVQLPPLLDITLVQPNLDPYNEKFSGNFKSQVQDMLKLAQSAPLALGPKLAYVPEKIWIFPETALTEQIFENEWSRSQSINLLADFQMQQPGVNILTGASTAMIYPIGAPHSETARKFPDCNLYYDNYNTALFFRPDTALQVYHKSKLVPGVEKMPFPILLKPLDALAINLGGTVGSLGTQNERAVFKTKGGANLAPIICYESVYGEFVTEYVKKGAQVLAIITNDGWWSDTPGYKHHLLYARLRAIETRKPVVRAANTGISALINPIGEIVQQSTWWKPAAIHALVQPRIGFTFYSQHGDYLGRLALLITTLIFVILVIGKIKSHKK